MFGKAVAGDASVLSSYDLCKYVTKLAYIRVLGYPVDVGQDQVVSLMGSPKLKEKATGYVAASLLMDMSEGSMEHMVATILADLARRGESSYEARGLALSFASRVSILKSGLSPHRARLASEAIALASDVAAPARFRQKAALCVAHFWRGDDDAPALERVADMLTEDLVRSAQSLGGENSDEYHGLALCAARVLPKLPGASRWSTAAAALAIELQGDALAGLPSRKSSATYHGVRLPWLRVALIEAFGSLSSELSETMLARLGDAVDRVARSRLGLQVREGRRRDANADAALMAIDLAWLEWGARCDRLDQSVRTSARSAIGKTAALSSDASERLACVHVLTRVSRGGPFESVRNIVDYHLKHADESCRVAALRLAVEACEPAAASVVADLLLSCVAVADLSFKTALVESILVVADRGAPIANSPDWLPSLVSRAAVECGGAAGRDKIWRRAVAVLERHGALPLAAVTVCPFLDQPTVGDSALRLTAVVLADYFRVAGRVGPGLPSAEEIFKKLVKHVDIRLFFVTTLDSLPLAAPSLRPKVDALLAELAEHETKARIVAEYRLSDDKRVAVTKQIDFLSGEDLFGPAASPQNDIKVDVFARPSASRGSADGPLGPGVDPRPKTIATDTYDIFGDLPASDSSLKLQPLAAQPDVFDGLLIAPADLRSTNPSPMPPTRDDAFAGLFEQTDPPPPRPSPVPPTYSDAFDGLLATDAPPTRQAPLASPHTAVPPPPNRGDAFEGLLAPQPMTTPNFPAPTSNLSAGSHVYYPPPPTSQHPPPSTSHQLPPRAVFDMFDSLALDRQQRQQSTVS